MIPVMLSLVMIAALAQPPTKTTVPGAVNVTRVDAAIACGGATTPEAFPELKKLGFSSIVNLRREQEPGVDIPGAKAAAATAGLKYVHIPVDGANPDPKSVEAFLAAVTNKANQPAYIHCGSANRVGAFWLIKRVVVDGWEIPRATEEAVTIGLTNEALKKFAIDYATANKKK
jgi:uncharacterized protein (TIGR01244 family)